MAKQKICICLCHHVEFEQITSCSHCDVVIVQLKNAIPNSALYPHLIFTFVLGNTKLICEQLCGNLKVIFNALFRVFPLEEKQCFCNIYLSCNDVYTWRVLMFRMNANYETAGYTEAHTSLPTALWGSTSLLHACSLAPPPDTHTNIQTHQNLRLSLKSWE